MQHLDLVLRFVCGSTHPRLCWLHQGWSWTPAHKLSQVVLRRQDEAATGDVATGDVATGDVATGGKTILRTLGVSCAAAAAPSGASGFCARWRSRWSASTQASIASPTGTARMPTQGSWRPLVRDLGLRARRDPPSRRGVRIELVGFTANRATIGWPVEMPPRMPPAWLRRERAPSPSCHAHLVGVLLAGQRGGGEAVADLHALHRVDPHQRRGEVGVELAVDRRAQARRHALGHHLDHRAGGRAGLAHRRQDRPPRSAAIDRVRAEERIVVRPASQSQRARSIWCGPICTSAPRMRTPSPSTLRATPPAATRIAVSRAEDRPPPR